MFLTRISVSQPVFATMVMVAITIFGLFSWKGLAIDEYPNVDFPVVAVVTSWPAASPETVEKEITEPIEDAVASVAGIESMRSNTSEGRSMVIIEFSLETDSIIAAQDVREKVSALADRLPEQADTPRVVRYDPNGSPIISMTLSGEGISRAELTRLADDVIAPTLTTIPGVGAATTVGGVDAEIHVEPDMDMLRAHGLSLSDLSTALGANNLSVSGGSIDNSLTVRSLQVDAEIRDIDDLRKIVVAERDGASIRIEDLALVRMGVSELSGLSFIDGAEALAIDVTKIEGGNTVAVAEAVLTKVAELEDSGRIGAARLTVVSDDSIAIRHSYETVQATLIEGAALATAIVFLFLNSWRSTVITGLTLPISILGTLAAISALGFTLNSMTMLALTLSIGILIDDAIVVRENITRHLGMGKGHVRASLDGTDEIGLAVMATTLSICAVFIPLAFMDGIIGKFFLEFGVTVSVAVLISLFVSFTLDPMMSSVWHDPHSLPGAKRGPIGRAVHRFEKGFDRLGEGYRHVLTWSLRRKKTTMAFVFATMAGSAALVPLVGFEFMPAKDEGRLTLRVKTAVGTSKDYTAIKVAQVTELVSGFEEVDSIYATISAGGRSGSNEARLVVELVDSDKRSRTTAELGQALRPVLQRVPGATVSISASQGVGGGRSPISIRVHGRSASALAEGAEIIVAAIEGVEGTRDVNISSDATQTIYELTFDRQMARALGVEPKSLGDTVQTLIAGREVTEIDGEDGIAVPVVLRLPQEMRQDMNRVLDMPVAQADDRSIALGEVAVLTEGVGPSRIEREERSRVVTVTANIEGRLLGDVMTDISAALAGIELPAGVYTGVGGEAEMMEETTMSMASALLLAVICIYLVLASQFGSFLQPIAIMASLPLSFGGVLLGLIVGGSTFNMFSMIGFIMLMGLVVKNGILLVDNANQRRREGADLVEALIEAGVTRFRPIIMTTLAMIFGMLPLALALHEGSEQNAPMAHAVIGGLISSTLLTLVVVPVMVVWIDKLSSRARRWFGPAPA